MKKKKRSTKSRRVKANKPQGDPISRRKRRRLLKTLAGAAIGGAIAGPVGMAAGAIVGASVRRGPVKKKKPPVAKTKRLVKTKTPRTKRAAKRRFTNIHPNIS